MNVSRRKLGLLVSIAALRKARSQTQILPSKAYRFEDLPVRTEGANLYRSVLNGNTASGTRLEIHETELPPGGAPHPPHHHKHEEMILMLEGKVRVTIEGKSTDLGPGSVAYVASNEEHGWQNTGPTHARYFVIAVGLDG
jgi:quercetin dioxygenase-like cupin family protein